MRLDFTLRGLDGFVDVDFGPTDDPQALGAWPAAKDLAHCQATVSYPGRGHLGQMGWVQLVCSTDNGSGGRSFEMDPLEILGTVTHPFCYFGITPTLFDAPARDDRRNLDWFAHSFLTYLDNSARGEVRALLGFSWGFTITDGKVALDYPARLDAAGWDAHTPLLAATYPEWTFATGFRQ